MTASFGDGKRMIEFSQEEAMVEVDKLEGLQTVDTGGSVVHSGRHPTLGNIHIVMPAIGAGFLLLPFAIQDF